jgi:hypothetical protein
MSWLPELLAIDREAAMISALASLSAAGCIFAIGAVVLFVRERRAARRDR